MSARRVLVIAAGAGAESRGDGAPGELVRRLRERPVAGRWWLTLLGDTQFQIEHAMDLQISDLAIFVDALDTGGPAFTFHRLQQPAGYRISTANVDLTPSDVMHTLATVGRRDELPCCFELRLGSSPSPGAGENGAGAQSAENLESALAFLEQLLAEPDPALWEQMSEG